MAKLINLAGQRFGKWTVIEKANRKGNCAYWICQCECGVIKEVTGRTLRNGQSTSCGHCNDIHIGDKFERWTVVAKDEEISRLKGKTHWICRCECGNFCVVGDDSLKRGNSKSCGCYNREVASELGKKRIGNKNPMYGQCGKKHPNYNPNLTDEDRAIKRCIDGYTEWKAEVKKQANYTCDCCGQVGGKLHSHHLENYKDNPNKIIDINNGVCLCEQCHKDFHSYMGGYKVPCTKEDYIKFKEERKSEDALVASF